MTRSMTWLAAAVLALGLSACGQNNITSGPAPTPTITATSIPTATPTATAIVPSSTPTLTPTVVPTASVTGTPAPAAATVLFAADVTSPANPFPSDRLRDASGHLRVPAGYVDPGLPPTDDFRPARAFVETITAQLPMLGGFGTFAPIRVRFDRPVVVGAGTNPRGLMLLEYNELSAAPPLFTASMYTPDLAVEIQPVVPLKPKTTYAVVVTSALVDEAGNHVRPSADFATLLSGTDLSPELAAWRARLQPVIDFLATTFGIEADQLALVDVFTTMPTTDDLLAIQQRIVSGELVPGPPVFDHPPRDLETGIFPEGTPQFEDLVGAPTSDNVAAVAVGIFDSYDFRTGPNGAFDPNYVHGPAVPPLNRVDFYVTIPKAPKPATGYPISLFGHGLGGSGRDVTFVAQSGTNAPIIGIAISALQHGRRGNVAKFFVLNNIYTTREHFRQTVADFLQLTQMIKNAQAAGIAPFDPGDPAHILYLGGSLGGIMGTLYMAVEPDVATGMLSVPGGGLPNILQSHDIGQLLEPLISLQVNIPQDNPFFPRFLRFFRFISQWSLESADPVNYAPYLIVPGTQLAGVPPKRILMHEGIIDNTIPNRTTDDLALAMRLPDLNVTRGCTDLDGCSGIWRFVMTDYGKPELSGHGVTGSVPQAGTQAFEFLNSFGTVITDASP